VAVLDLDTGQQKVLLQDARSAKYVASGHLVYAVGSDLHAIGFDVASLTTKGTPVPVLRDVATMPSQVAYFDVSKDGTFVYMTGSNLKRKWRLAWVDRSGREEFLPSPARAYGGPRLSPDGTRIAITISEAETHIWILDVNRDAPIQFTLGRALDGLPLWSPNGDRLYFGSNREGAMQTFWQAADGTGQPERLTDGPGGWVPSSISPDGSQLVLQYLGSAPDLALLQLDSHAPPRPLIHTADIEGKGQISPDGRWIAYEMWRRGRPEVHVRPFPDVSAGSWQVTSGGGSQPIWARNSEELFYVDMAGALMGVRVSPHGKFAAPERVLEPRSGALDLDGGRMYDVSPDGRRFLMLKSPEGASATAARSLVVVQNWFQELRQLVGVQ
jgi:Tol biopolymer transport system component